VNASRRITERLQRAHPAILNGYIVLLAFATYFCMYAFRKPFAAAHYDGQSFAGTQVELKTAFVISQICGYALSKFLGIKVCSEAGRQRRAAALIGLMLAAELALVLFAVVPLPWKVAAIFLNGLPLGMVWGLVVRYLEGRRTSELLLAGLSCSFIVSSGVVKDVGRNLLAGRGLFGIDALRFPAPVSDFWMPAATGILFLPPLLACAWLLDCAPEPAAADVAARAERTPMNRAGRNEFLRRFTPGMMLLVVAYFFLTAFRDFRDNYIVDVLADLGYRYEANQNALTVMESAVALGVLAAMAALFLVRDNRRGLFIVFALMILGMGLLGFSTWLWRRGLVSGMSWVMLLGLGTYLAYVPYNSLLFDRLIASTRVAGTAVFAIYVADSLGYVGSVAVQLYKDLGSHNSTRADFLADFAYFLSVLGAATLAASCVYFLRWRDHSPSAEPVDGSTPAMPTNRSLPAIDATNA
jgi:MFS family permease